MIFAILTFKYQPYFDETDGVFKNSKLSRRDCWRIHSQYRTQQRFRRSVVTHEASDIDEPPATHTSLARRPRNVFERAMRKLEGEREY
jgi:hypothetical protein